MKRRLLGMMASLLLCGTMSAQHYTPNAHDHETNMPIVAQVTLDGSVPTATNLELGAYIDGTVRGSATLQSALQYQDNGTYWIQVFFDATESSLPITFKLWDGTDEYTSDLATVTPTQEGTGTLAAPLMIDFATTQTMTQTTSLAAGWTWWSTPIEQNGINGLLMLENSLGSNGVTIKGQNNSAAYSTILNRWVGNCPIVNEASYMINVTNACDVVMSGVIANPEDHQITIEPNWNWIGYPVTQNQTILAALGNGFQPSVGDVVKDQDNSAVYLSTALGWRPADFTFNTGCGYMYYSKASSNKTLTYSNTRGSDVNNLVDNRHWHANCHVAEGNITLLGEVFVDGKLQRSEDFELGAFVNGECRGSAKLLYIEPIDAYYVIMTITGEDGDLVEFELFNAQDGSVNTQSYSYINFVQNDIVGEPGNPYPINFIGYEAMLNIFPNPVDRNQSFTLNIPQHENVVQTIITDVTGTVIAQIRGSQRFQSGISVSGVYFVKVICESGRIYNGRIIVK